MIDRKDALNIAGAGIAGGLVIILGFLTWALVFREVPQANQSSLSILLGLLGAQISAVVGFFFGSSISTKKQTETIDTLAKTAQTAGVALAPVPDVTLAPGASLAVKAETESP